MFQSHFLILDNKMTKVNAFEAKIKGDIENALNLLKSVDEKDQLLTFLLEDIEELQKKHVDSEYDE
jgi:hypothetical protein